MAEVHIHIHGSEEPAITLPVADPVPVQYGKIEQDESLLWERIGEIRKLQIEDVDADEKTRERRQGWVAGMLQSIQIIRSEMIEDVSDVMWEECNDRFPFPSQKSEFGTLADYRDLKPTFKERQEELVPEEHRSQTPTRTISPVEALADPELAHLVVVEDATGEEPDAVVSDEMFTHATGQVSDS